MIGLPLVVLIWLDHMGMGTDNQVSTRINRYLGQMALMGTERGEILGPPMHKDNDEICLLTRQGTSWRTSSSVSQAWPGVVSVAAK